jgi:hypothetical protein
MADRRADETPLAPRRSLAGPSRPTESTGDTGKRPLTERVSSAVAAAGSAVQSAASSGTSSRSTSTGSGPARPRSGSSMPGGSDSGRTSSSSARAGSPTARPRGTRRGAGPRAGDVLTSPFPPRCNNRGDGATRMTEET